MGLPRPLVQVEGPVVEEEVGADSELAVVVVVQVDQLELEIAGDMSE